MRYGILDKDRFLTGTYNKMKYKKIGPCQIIKKINKNANGVDLMTEYDILHVFNITNLYNFQDDEQLVEAVIDRQ